MQKIRHILTEHLREITIVALVIELCCIALVTISPIFLRVWVAGLVTGILTFAVHLAIIYITSKDKESEYW